MNRVVLIACFVACFLTTANAGVETHSDVVYYNWGGHNEMLGVVSAFTDYSATYYYCGKLKADLSRKEEDEEVAANVVESSFLCEASYFQAEASLPYVASSDYEVIGSTELELVFIQDGHFYDAFDYSYFNDLYLNGVPMFFPLGYSFNGGGYPQSINYSQLFLGLINSYRETNSSTVSNEAHHLLVTKDIQVSTSCGTKRREISYRIVDINEKSVGKSIHREYHQNKTNVQCVPQGSLPSPSVCYVSVSGGVPQHRDMNPFTDLLQTGCTWPANGCGFTIDKQLWASCRPIDYLSYTDYNIAKMLTDVRSEQILIDGQAQWPKDKKFVP